MLKASAITDYICRFLKRQERGKKTRPVDMPRRVRRDDVRELERQVEFALGVHLPLGEEMQREGLWQIVEEDA